jgi:hypothetical protein
MRCHLSFLRLFIQLNRLVAKNTIRYFLQLIDDEFLRQRVWTKSDFVARVRLVELIHKNKFANKVLSRLRLDWRYTDVNVRGRVA